MRPIVACVSVLVASGFGLTGCQHAAVHMHDGPTVPVQYGKSFERYASEMNVGMAKMMSDMHAPGYTGDTDIDFIAMMIPHHQGAVDMARLVLQDGTDPVTRKLAEEIIASQTVEIEGMTRRLAQLRSGVKRTVPDGYPALGGTRGSQPLKD